VTDVDPSDPDPKPSKPWSDLAPRVIPPNDLIEIHPIKGTNGTDCAPTVPPVTPGPSASDLPDTSLPDTSLPDTGTKAPWQPLGVGLALLLLGALAVIVSRRVRARG
jgi:LPXTG-motif cell wall-anchored protein